MKLEEINQVCAWLENNSMPETLPDGTNRYPMIRASALIRYLYRENKLLNLGLEHCLSHQKNELSKSKNPRSGT